MHIKYFLVVLILMNFYSSNSNAQPCRKIEIYTSYDIYNYGNKGLRKSMKSLESYWNQHGEPNLNVKGFKTASDFNYGINYLSKSKGSKKYLLYGFQHYKQSSLSQAEYAYGSRFFHILTKGATLYAGTRKLNGLTYKLGFGFYNSVLESYYKYPSGVISFGKDKSMNGVYGTSYGSNFNFEITKQKIFFKHIGLEAGILLTTCGFSTEYYDANYPKSMNVHVNYSWIPQDYEAFYTSVNNTDVYEGKNVKSNNNSIGFILRASYIFNIKKDKK